MACLSPPEVLFKELEADTTCLRYVCWESFRKLADQFKAVGDDKGTWKAETEAAALMLCDAGRSFPGFFQPLMVSTDGATVPPRDFFNIERLEYLAERAITSSNPIHAARYADVVWDLSPSGKKNPEMARISIDRYLEAAEIYKANRWGIEFADALKRAAYLCCMIRDRERLPKVQNIILRYMQDLDARKEYRFCLDLVEALTKSPPCANER